MQQVISGYHTPKASETITLMSSCELTQLTHSNGSWALWEMWLGVAKRTDTVLGAQSRKSSSTFPGAIVKLKQTDTKSIQIHIQLLRINHVTFFEIWFWCWCWQIQSKCSFNNVLKLIKRSDKNRLMLNGNKFCECAESFYFNNNVFKVLCQVSEENSEGFVFTP